MGRKYDELVQTIAPGVDRAARMQCVVDAIWTAFSRAGVSWVGFYLPNARNEDELLLGPRRDKPACSPIGMHGACGRAFRERRALIVRDVADLGNAYIACDPRDRSEVVVPCVEPDGHCWAVLDLDSHATGAFDAEDVRGLTRLLVEAGLTQRDARDDRSPTG